MPVRSVFSQRDVAEITCCSNLRSLAARTKGEEGLNLIYVASFVQFDCSSGRECRLNGDVVKKGGTVSFRFCSLVNA